MRVVQKTLLIVSDIGSKPANPARKGKLMDDGPGKQRGLMQLFNIYCVHGIFHYCFLWILAHIPKHSYGPNIKHAKTSFLFIFIYIAAESLLCTQWQGQDKVLCLWLLLPESSKSGHCAPHDLKTKNKQASWCPQKLAEKNIPPIFAFFYLNTYMFQQNSKSSESFCSQK